MDDYVGLFSTWRELKSEDFRAISRETFLKAKVCVEYNEAIFPYGLNQQAPDRFKTWDPRNKGIHIYSKKSLKDDYKMPFFNQQNFEDKSYLIITEGEWDCLSWIEAGYENVVSIPTGSASAKSTINNDDGFEYLRLFKKIYINFDNDKAGQKALEDIKPYIPEYKLRIINIDIDGYKDANDLLKDGFELKPFFDNAEKPESLNVVCISEIPTSNLFNATPRGLTTGFISIDEILGGIRPGEITVITGDTGVGKTSLACNIALNFTECTGEKAWVTSQEMDSDKLFEKITSVHIEYPLRNTMDESKVPKFKMDKIEDFKRRKRLFLDPNGPNMTLDSVIKGVDYAKYVSGIKLVVVEDLGTIAGTLKGPSIENYDKVMRALHSKAIETGMHILLIVHPTQTFDDKGSMWMANLKGSASIKQTANNVLIIQRCDRAYPENQLLKDKVIVRITKNRALGKEGLAILKYHEYYDGYSDSSLSINEFYDLINTKHKKMYKKDF